MSTWERQAPPRRQSKPKAPVVGSQGHFGIEGQLVPISKRRLVAGAARDLAAGAEAETLGLLNGYLRALDGGADWEGRGPGEEVVKAARDLRRFRRGVVPYRVVSVTTTGALLGFVAEHVTGCLGLMSRLLLWSDVQKALDEGKGCYHSDFDNAVIVHTGRRVKGRPVLIVWREHTRGARFLQGYRIPGELRAHWCQSASRRVLRDIVGLDASVMFIVTGSTMRVATRGLPIGDLLDGCGKTKATVE